MSILTTLQGEMTAAMKARDQARLDALRLIVSAIRYVEKDLLAQAGTANLSDEQIVGVLTKEAKKRREAIEAYISAGREAAAAKEQYELSLIESYLPKMMSEDEVRAIVKKALDQSKAENFGMAMKTAMGAVGNGAEGGTVLKIVKELLHS